MKKTAILSILLCLCMVISLLPGVNAFAAEGDLTITVDDKTFTATSGNWIYNEEVTDKTAAGYDMIVMDNTYEGNFATNGWGIAIVLDAEGIISKIYDGAWNRYYTSTGRDMTVSVNAATYAADAFAALADGETLIVFPNDGSNGAESPRTFAKSLADGNYWGKTAVLEGLPVEEEGGENAGSFDVETTDTYWFAPDDLHSFTAPVAGTYTFELPAGLGLQSKESWDSYGMPEMDFYSNEEGATVSFDLAEGEVFEFYVGATEKKVWTVNWTCVPGEVGGGDVGGDEPAIDTSVLNGVYEAQFWGTPMYKLTFNNGTLTIASLDTVANDVSGTYTYTVVEGLPVPDTDSFLISKDAGGNLTFQPNGFAMPMTLVKTGELSGGDVGGGDEPVDPPAEPGESDLVLGENSVEVSQENAAFGQEFVFVATEAGNYVLTATDSNAYISVDGGYNYIATGENAEFTLEAGESITIMVGCFSESADTIEFTIEVKEEGDEPAPEGPIVVYGPDHLNESYSEGYLGAGESQEYMLYYPANGYLVVDAYYAYVTINGEQHFCMYGGTFQLTEEDAVNVDENGFGYVSIIVQNTYASDYEIYFEYPEGSGENPEELDSLHKVEHTVKPDGTGYYYSWIADFTGDLTIYLNQPAEGAIIDIAVTNKNNEDWNTNSASLVTYDDDFNRVVNDSLTIAVTEGDTLLIHVIEISEDWITYVGGDIIFSNREALVADGSSNDPFDLPMGEWDVYIDEEAAYDGYYYIFTAPTDGILTVDAGSLDMTGIYLSGLSNNYDGTYTKEMSAGDTIKINVWSYNEIDFVVNVSFGEVEPELGSEDLPEEIDSIDGLVFNSDNSDYYYAWTATEDGTLVITMSTSWNYGYSLQINGQSLYGDGSEMEIEVKAGDKIVLVNSVYASASSDGSITLAAAYDNGEEPVDPPVDPEDPIDPTGDYTFVVFAMVILSMTALVVLVSKKRAF